MPDHLDEPVGGWCPQCRSPYRPGVSACPTCDVVLVHELPPLPPPPPELPHDVVSYDLAGWEPDQRAGLELRLRGYEIEFTWDGPELVVAATQEDVVDQLVDEIDELDDTLVLPADAGDVDEDSALDAAPKLAGLWDRFLGQFIDGLILGPLTYSARHGSFGAVVVSQLIVVIYSTVCVGRWGRTIGKRFAGTKVVRVDTNNRVSWNAAFVRAVIPALAAVSRLGNIGVVLGLAWYVAVYAGIFRKPWRQGLHDRAAGTIVVLVTGG